MSELSPRITQYYSGQGEVYIGPVGGYDPAAVPPVGFRWLGNVSSLVVTPAEEATEHKESWSGERSGRSQSWRRRTRSSPPATSRSSSAS